jgi:sensor domain CHASE-containing protein
MSVHSDYMFVINPHGKLKWIVSDDPPSDVSGRNSAASELLVLLHEAGLTT